MTNLQEKMLEKLNTKKAYNLFTLLVMIIVTIFMFYWIGQKEGFHEDEIFSYGSSNYKWDNVYQAAGKSDFLNRAIEKYVIGDSFGETINNINYYLKNPSEFGNLASEIQKGDKPVWKTSEDAKEYATIGEGDVFNYFSVYYNQSRDVHPPLFYALVHLFSSIAYGIFSKYIIFAINLIFFLLTCYTIRKIFILFNKKWLGLIAILLYGLSMGAASTVIFLRMYSMITFFSLEYLFLNLRILKNNLQISKSDKWKLFGIVLLGFLTQYYFCIFVMIVFVLMSIRMIYKKQYKVFGKYLLIHIITALVGIIIFPASIYHIFFSYRGAGGAKGSMNFIQAINFYLERLSEAFSINNVFMFVLLGIILIGIIARVITKIVKKEKIKNIYSYILLILPTIIYFIFVSKIAPDVEAKYAIRYIMPILPEISIIFVFMLYKIFANKRIALLITCSSVIIITVNGFITNEPKYLYRGYNNYVDIANKYKNLDFVYTVDNAFTYLTSMPEFMIYNKSLIINMNYDKLDFLKTDTGLQSQEQFVLSIKKWMNVEDTLNKILEYTGFTKYELLLNQEDDTQSMIYLITK